MCGFEQFPRHCHDGRSSASPRSSYHTSSRALLNDTETKCNAMLSSYKLILAYIKNLNSLQENCLRTTISYLQIASTEAKTWRYWPNIGCFNFNFERTIFFELTDDATMLLTIKGSHLRKLQKAIIRHEFCCQKLIIYKPNILFFVQLS